MSYCSIWQINSKFVVEVYEAKNSFQLFYRDSRTLNAASRRIPKRAEGANKDLCFLVLILLVFLVVKTTKVKGPAPELIKGEL